MTLRIVFWVVLALLVVLAVRSKLRGMKHGPGPGAAPGRALAEGEAMACCAHCHVYFPASEAVRADGVEYCSPAHVRLPAQ